MSELITGLIGIIMVVGFLGYYALMIGSIPLWIIVVLILAMAVADLVQTLMKKDEKDTGNDLGLKKLLKSK